MAKVRWIGGAPAVAQVTTVTISAYDATTTYKVTIGNQTISTVGTGGTTSTTASALQALLSASTIQQFAEITWTVLSNVITGTAKTAGYPFTLSTSVTGGAGTISNSTTTANSGPNDASIGANWSTSSIPANGDDIYFDNGSFDVLYGLNQSSVTPTSINILPGYSGKIGLPKTNVNNSSATYPEYRPDYLQYGATTINVNGGGGRIKLDNGSTAVTWNVLSTSQQRFDNGVPVLLLKGTSTSNVLNHNKGDSAVSFYAGESSGISALKVGYVSNQASDSTVWMGADVTYTNAACVQTGGTLTINSTISSTGSLTQYGGTVYILGSAAINQLYSIGTGTVVYSSTGTLGGNTEISGSATLDFSQDLRAKTVTNPIKVYSEKATINDPNKVVSSLVLSLQDVKNNANLMIGTGMTLTRS